MRWFRSKPADERIDQLKNKIYKEAYVLVVAISYVSALVKMIVLEAKGIAPIASELAILLLSSIYFLARSTKMGLYADEVEVHDRSSKWPMSAKNVLIGCLIGLTIAVFFGARSAVIYADGFLQAIGNFLLVGLISLLIYLPLFAGVMLLLHATAHKISKRASQIPEE